MPDSSRPTAGEITILAAGVVALVFSFFDFHTIDVAGFSDGASVWSSGLFPVAALMVIFVVIMALQIALTTFAHVSLPDRPLGFTWEQVHLVLGFFATLYSVAYLLQKRAGYDFGIGFWFILIASIAALVGAILLRGERAGRSAGF
jgi:hypothetical protein